MVEEQRNMYEHFSKLAISYVRMRTTDEEPIVFISNRLKHLRKIEAADIGCGQGRYDLLLFKNLSNLHLTCIDMNEVMLEETYQNLKSHGITNFKTIKADANELPLDDYSLDCIFTFNTMNQFDIPKFMQQVSKVIKENGLVFIYTRLRSQNGRNIWGKYFPKFFEKENRLPEFHEINAMTNSTLFIESVKDFKFERRDTLRRLINKARNRFYSVFSLYDEEELEECIKVFEKNVISNFKDTEQVEWLDEYSLLILKRLT